MSLATLRACSAATRATVQRRTGGLLSSAAMVGCCRRRDLSSAASESDSVGFVGLGKIGFAMAKNMMDAGYSLTVFDVDPAAVDRLVAEGATGAGSAAEVASATSRLVTVLPNDAVLHQVVDEVHLDCVLESLCLVVALAVTSGLLPILPGEVSSPRRISSRRMLYCLSAGGACCRRCPRET